MPSDKPRKQPATFMRQLALAMELPFLPVGGVVIGGGIGYWLDLQFHTRPLFALVLGLLGFAGGVREVLRRIPKDEGEDGSE